jgi:hypothetical protein
VVARDTTGFPTQSDAASGVVAEKGSPAELRLGGAAE